jgi:sterol desaturase/sphingolipid hydroxylase (fatty acid hydroxylase superfamily)
MSKQYEYGERHDKPMPERTLRFGEGRIAGLISLTLGVLAFLSVLAWLYPEYLTTRELRQVYDMDLLRIVLRVGMIASIAFGIFNFVRCSGQRWLGAIGVVLTISAYVMGGTLPVHAVEQVGPGIGVDWMVLDLLKSTVIFIFLEKIFPKYREQPILRPEWDLDLGYFAMNHLLLGVVLMIANHFAPAVFGWAVNDTVQSFVSGLWLPAQVLLLMFCADFVQYWIHRAYHEIPWLWGLHAVHHSTEHLDWLAGSRNHIVQTIVDRSLVLVPLYLLGPSTEALNIYVLIVAFQAVLVHSNIGIPFGPLGYLFVTPKFHHWHHSKDKPAIDTNYAAHLPVMDLIFGTFHMPKDHWPREYGTLTRLPRTFLAQLVYPFRKPE